MNLYFLAQLWNYDETRKLLTNKKGGQIFTNEKFTLPLQGKHGKIINSSGQVLGIKKEPDISSDSSSSELDLWEKIQESLGLNEENEQEIGVILQDSSETKFQNWFRGMPNSSGHFTLKNSITGRFLTATSIRSTKTTVTGISKVT
jgi:hypothetical protein